MLTDEQAADTRLETKFMAFDSVETADGGLIEGYASLFNCPDQSGDEVAPGAFAATLSRLGSRVKLLWQHDAAKPIGVWESLREDGRGLQVRGRLIPEVQAGAEAIALLKAGALDGLSIGFRTVRAAKLPDGRRRLLEVALWEISLVTFPMLPEARVDPGSDPAELRSLAEALTAARRVIP